MPALSGTHGTDTSRGQPLLKARGESLEADLDSITKVTLALQEALDANMRGLVLQPLNLPEGGRHVAEFKRPEYLFIPNIRSPEAHRDFLLLPAEHYKDCGNRPTPMSPPVQAYDNSGVAIRETYISNAEKWRHTSHAADILSPAAFVSLREAACAIPSMSDILFYSPKTVEGRTERENLMKWEWNASMLRDTPIDKGFWQIGTMPIIYVTLMLKCAFVNLPENEEAPWPDDGEFLLGVELNEWLTQFMEDLKHFRRKAKWMPEGKADPQGHVLQLSTPVGRTTYQEMLSDPPAPSVSAYILPQELAQTPAPVLRMNEDEVRYLMAEDISSRTLPGYIHAFDVWDLEGYEYGGRLHANRFIEQTFRVNRSLLNRQPTLRLRNDDEMMVEAGTATLLCIMGRRGPHVTDLTYLAALPSHTVENKRLLPVRFFDLATNDQVDAYWQVIRRYIMEQAEAPIKPEEHGTSGVEEEYTCAIHFNASWVRSGEKKNGVPLLELEMVTPPADLGILWSDFVPQRLPVPPVVMGRQFEQILDFGAVLRKLQEMIKVLQDKANDFTLVDITTAHKKYIQDRSLQGDTAEPGPPLFSQAPTNHQDSYAFASGDCVGKHAQYGDPKDFRELVGSWRWFFGFEAVLILMHLLRVAGPPMIMEKQTLSLWQAGELTVEPHRFFTAWGKFCMNLNNLMNNLVRFGALPGPGEASVFLYLRTQFRNPHPEKHFETSFGKARTDAQRLFPESLLFRFHIELDASGSNSMWNRRYLPPPDWAATYLLKEEKRRIEDNDKWKPKAPEGTAEYMQRQLQERQSGRVTGFVLNEAKKIFMETSGHVPALREVNVAIGRVYDQLPEYWQEKVDFGTCPSDVMPPSQSEVEFIRRNFSARQQASSAEGTRVAFPVDLISAEDRQKALRFHEHNDFSSGDFWPIPGTPGATFDCHYD